MGAPHLDKFLETARYFIGLQESGNNRFTDPRGQELWNLWGGNANGTPWCAIFVSACAKKADILNVVIAKSSWARGILEDTRDRLGGTWIDGPFLNGGNGVMPQPGDCILFYTGPGRDDRHVGIVESVDPNTDTITTIEGNASDACRRKEYRSNHSTIYAYVRPDWTRVGDDVNSPTVTQDGTIGPLYNSRNDRHDMTLREVGYLKNYELSNHPSNISISVINYTSVLGDLYEMFAPLQVTEPQINTSQLFGNVKVAMDYFLEQGFRASAAAGLTACLEIYSEIDPSFSSMPQLNIFLYGIGAWQSIILERLRERIGNEWSTNLSGQLEFFLYDLEENYKLQYLLIKAKPLDISNVEKVVDILMSTYNRFYNTPAFISNAKRRGREIYEQLIITYTQVIGNAAMDLKDINGNPLTPQYSKDIPADLVQPGIQYDNDFTSYSYWYPKWAATSNQRKLSRVWSDQGYPSNKGIATIGGYYCAAVKIDTFGNVGEVIVVTLEDNTTIPIIIADLKAAGAEDSPWGHIKTNKYGVRGPSFVEWEVVKSINGRVVTSGISATDRDGTCESIPEWYCKKVINITNYGSYIQM